MGMMKRSFTVFGIIIATCVVSFFKKAENRLVDTFLGSVSLSDFFFAIGLRSIYYFANVHEKH